MTATAPTALALERAANGHPQPPELPFVEAKAYTGRIVLAGSPGAVVKVTLIWGKGPTDRQAINLHTIGTGYRRVPLRYTAAAETDNATRCSSPNFFDGRSS